MTRTQTPARYSLCSQEMYLVMFLQLQSTQTEAAFVERQDKPAVNQIELHPVSQMPLIAHVLFPEINEEYLRLSRHLPQTELLSFCRDNSIHVTAHQPLVGAQ